MNQTETAYAELLEGHRLAGDVLDWKFEAMTFRLTSSKTGAGPPAVYTPDFMVQHADCTISFIEVKGGGLDDRASIVRIKVAAQQFTQFRFCIARRLPKREGGGFNVKEF